MADPIETTEERTPTTVEHALAGVGMVGREDGEVVLASITPRGIRHFTLPQVADADPADAESLYVASGLFAPGVVTINGGRSTEHCTRVVWLPFDADLIAMLDGDPAEKMAQLHAASQSELDDILADQIAEVDRAFEMCGWPVHRLDYTGYGLCAYVYVDERDQHRVQDAQKTHKRAVAALNDAAGFRLFDVQVSDAGPRITRVPGSLNRKGKEPRTVRTLRPWDGSTLLLTHRVEEQPAYQAVAVPVDGAGLSAEAVDGIVGALQPHWHEGQKHAMGMAVGGLLAKSGVPEQQAVGIVGRLAAGDRKPYDRFNALRTSYARVRAGQPVAGYTALESLIPTDTLTFVTETLDRFQQSTVAVPDLSAFQTKAARSHTPRRRLEASDLGDDQFARSMPPVPDICFYGEFARYRDLMAPTTQAPDAYHLAVSLAWFGALMGRRIRTEEASEELFGNLFVVLVGASGSTKKDTAIRRALHRDRYYPAGTGMRDAKFPFSLGTSLQSSEGLILDVSENPRQFIYLSEFSAVQKNAQRKGTRTIFDTLIACYDAPPILSNNSISNRKQAPDPFVSFIAATQPKRLADQMTDEDIHSGFANRILFVIGAGKPSMARPPAVDRQEAWQLYLDWVETISNYYDPSTLYPTPEADELWDEWFDRFEQEAVTEDEAEMRQRVPTNARKLSLIYAASDGSTVIERHHLEPAIAFVEWCWSVTKEMLKGWAIGTELQIELAITRALDRAGPMHRRDLQRRCSNRKWSGRDFAATFRGMVENRVLDVDPHGIVSTAGKTPMAGDPDV